MTPSERVRLIKVSELEQHLVDMRAIFKSVPLEQLDAVESRRMGGGE
jgi:hypothetical protein